ncbi:MAG: Hydantoinase B/oxoprolinase, partial [Chloroflexota bacterium]|nr:Hydantoinase B/oxoprolinase [Chloroflexota bacterium]
GGASGALGENRRLAGMGDHTGSPLPGKITFAARAGERIGIATPGGGGYGAYGIPVGVVQSFAGTCHSERVYGVT